MPPCLACPHHKSLEMGSSGVYLMLIMPSLWCMSSLNYFIVNEYYLISEYYVYAQLFIIYYISRFLYDRLKSLSSAVWNAYLSKGFIPARVANPLDRYGPKLLIHQNAWLSLVCTRPQSMTHSQGNCRQGKRILSLSTDWLRVVEIFKLNKILDLLLDMLSMRIASITTHNSWVASASRWMKTCRFSKDKHRHTHTCTHRQAQALNEYAWHICSCVLLFVSLLAIVHWVFIWISFALFSFRFLFLFSFSFCVLLRPCQKFGQFVTLIEFPCQGYAKSAQ